MSEIITKEALLKLVDEWIRQGKHAAGPAQITPDRCLYVPLAGADQLKLDGFIHPANSIKEFFFPREEKIYTYKFKGKGIELEDAIPQSGEQLVFARPCDAAALPVLDSVFNWDYEDPFYNQRRAAATVVTLACSEYDDNCFCTSVGLSPSSEKGADAILLPTEKGEFEVRCITDKGKALFAGKTTQAEHSARVAAEPEKQFDAAEIRKLLEENFEDPAWKSIALRCVGCGACAYLCPTCHCFDIVDEGDCRGGCRRKNWDSCQFGMFTMHASGHNPRGTQGVRQRQRIQHKFRIYPEKFNSILCTGCGNCTRLCPVDLGVLNTLVALRDAALQASEGC